MTIEFDIINFKFNEIITVVKIFISEKLNKVNSKNKDIILVKIKGNMMQLMLKMIHLLRRKINS
jgi:hypothetical protein